MDEKISMSIKYIDKAVYDRLCAIAASKGKKLKNKTDLFEWIMKDYIDMHDIDEFRNPYLLNHITTIIDSAVRGSEKRLGGRMFTLLCELSININILNKIIYRYMNQYTDPREAKQDYDKFRHESIEELRHRDLAPMTYVDFVKQDQDIAVDNISED